MIMAAITIVKLIYNREFEKLLVLVYLALGDGFVEEVNEFIANI